MPSAHRQGEATKRAERFCPLSLLLLLDDAPMASPASKRRKRKQNRFRYRLWGFLTVRLRHFLEEVELTPDRIQ